MPFWNQSDARKSYNLTAPEAGSQAFFPLLTPPPPAPPNGESSFSPLLLNLRVGRDARPKGRPHSSAQNATTIELSLPPTPVWKSFCTLGCLTQSAPVTKKRVCGGSGGDLSDHEMLGWKAQTLTRRLHQEYVLDGCEISERETLVSPWDIATTTTTTITTRFRGATISSTVSQSPQHGLGC